MLNKNKIAIISSGNGGQSMAAYLALQGYEISLYVREKERVMMFPDDYCFSLTGLFEGSPSISSISYKMAEVVKDAHLIMVTTPAQYHEDIAKEMANCLQDDQIIVLNPGRTFGSHVFYNVLHAEGNDKAVIVAEAETFVFACRCARVAEPSILGMKNVVRVAAYNKKDTNLVVSALDPMFPGVFKAAKSTIETSFSNIGVIFHPLPILLNITRVEKKEKFLFYREGITPLVANIIEQMDRERVAVAKAYGVEVQTAFDWLAAHYGAVGETLYERIQNTPAYETIYAPTNTETRYIYEDIATGCVPIYYAGKKVGIDTRIINSAILWASTIYATDFKQNGRNEELIDFDKLLQEATHT